jgi:hypothetical protein
VLTNRQLVELALQRPRSRQALGDIPGLGDKKIARFGGELLQALWPDGGAGADQATDAGQAADAPTPETAGDQPPEAQA